MSMIGYFLLTETDSLEALLKEPTTIYEFLESSMEEGGGDFVDIDKGWHLLHYLLTGTAWEGETPLNFVVTGGKDIGEEDVGYGPARAFTDNEVRAIADALDRIDREQLLKRFNGQEMNELEIYPPIDWKEVELSEALLGEFDTVKELVDRGRTLGKGMIVWCA